MGTLTEPEHGGQLLFVTAVLAYSAPTTALGPKLTLTLKPAITFETIYRQHHDFVWALIRRLGVPAAAVDDVVQDVFLVVNRKLKDYADRERPRAWLVAIARRVAADHRRTERRARDRLRGVRPPPPTTTPEQQAQQREAAHIVAVFLDTLDEDQRMAFYLMDVQQMTAPEVAEALGVNVNTVYSRVRLARRKFEHMAKQRQVEAP